jgi:gluconolactonase
MSLPRVVSLVLGSLFPVIGAVAEPFALPAPYPLVGRIEPADQTDPKLEALVDLQARFEVVADGFGWSEGPLWLPAEEALVLSDVPANVSYRWSEKGGLHPFLAPSGYSGPVDGKPHQGSNGMALDPAGRVLVCQHGDRRVVRRDNSGALTVLADRFDGRRFNSPNDLVGTRAGVLFFTDPPYGLGSAKAELDFSGVYRLAPDGKVTLVSLDLSLPNGIALSPDERTLYVACSDRQRPVVMAIPLDAQARPDGAARLLFDSAPLAAKLGIERPVDGLAVDERGNLWVAGPGGIVVASPDGEYLGTLFTGRDTANCTFGGPDGRTLYVTAANVLLRVSTKVRGASPAKN